MSAGLPLVPPAADPPRAEGWVARLSRRLRWAVRDVFARRPVTREVQGVRMTLPWSHRLPDYARGDSPYGQNLVRLAEHLGRTARPLRVLDVGANIGDSALQVLDKVEARLLCVEADEFYLGFLRSNTEGSDAVVIEASLLQPHEAATSDMVPVRTGGTTHFVPGGPADATPAVSVAELRRRHPDFDQLRLVKSDTDGYDVSLVPALAAAYAHARPVLFFEYDPVLTRAAGLDPRPVWDELARLGYAEVAIWDNGGRPLARLPIGLMPAAAAELEAEIAAPRRDRWRRATAYWDVAVVHDSDHEGLSAIAALVPGRR